MHIPNDIDLTEYAKRIVFAATGEGGSDSIRFGIDAGTEDYETLCQVARLADENNDLTLIQVYPSCDRAFAVSLDEDGHVEVGTEDDLVGIEGAYLLINDETVVRRPDR